MALQVTVTPMDCPWGFNTTTRTPTALETAKRDLCLIELYIERGWVTVTDDVREWLDSLWTRFEDVSRNIGAYSRAVVDTLRDDVKRARDYLENEMQSLEQWFQSEASETGFELLLLVGLIGAVFFAPEILAMFATRRRK